MYIKLLFHNVPYAPNVWWLTDQQPSANMCMSMDAYTVWKTSQIHDIICIKLDKMFLCTLIYYAILSEVHPSSNCRDVVNLYDITQYVYLTSPVWVSNTPASSSSQ